MILIIQHLTIEGPGLFKEILSSLGIKTVTIDFEKKMSLPNINDFRGIIVMGGSMNVYETGKYPFLLEEEKFLKQAIKKGLPTLGICLGAQMLAKVMGARIKKSPVKEIGFYDLSFTPLANADPLFLGINKDKLKVFQWHEDTFDLPKKAALIIQGDTCVNQAFRFDEYVWGFQFHPEITESLIADWCKDSKDPMVDEQAFLQDYKKYKKEYKEQARLITENFISSVDIKTFMDDMAGAI